MSENLTYVIVALIICGAVFGVVSVIAICVNFDTIVRGYLRWRKGEAWEPPCPSCGGSGENRRDY